jgi:hypothetical protein
MADETWFTADEALAVGLADEVVPMKPKKTEAAPADAKLQASWDLSMYRYPGRTFAPDPVAKKAMTVNVELDGKDITEAVIDPIRRAVGQRGLKPGQRITAEAVAALPEGEVVVAAKTVAELSTDELIKLITDTVTAQLDSKLPAFLQPDEDDDEDEEEAEDASTEEPEDRAPENPVAPADAVPIPPEGLKAGDGDPPSEHPVDTGLGDDTVESTETNDQADDWNSVVGLLHAPTSSCADDVFARLKEEW